RAWIAGAPRVDEGLHPCATGIGHPNGPQIAVAPAADNVLRCVQLMRVLERDEVLPVRLGWGRDSRMDTELIDVWAVRVGELESNDIIAATPEGDGEVKLVPIIPGAGAEEGSG